jgi:hypothetical protein
LLALFVPVKLLFMIQIARRRLEKITSKLELVAYYFIMEIWPFTNWFLHYLTTLLQMQILIDVSWNRIWKWILIV